MISTPQFIQMTCSDNIWSKDTLAFIHSKVQTLLTEIEQALANIGLLMEKLIAEALSNIISVYV